MRGKKGYGVADIAPMVIMLGLAIIVTVVMAQVTAQLAADNCAADYTYNTTADRCYNSTGQWNSGLGETYASNISGYGLEGLDELGSWFDTIGLVLAAAVIIGILVYAFAFRK